MIFSDHSKTTHNKHAAHSDTQSGTEYFLPDWQIFYSNASTDG